MKNSFTYLTGFILALSVALTGCSDDGVGVDPEPPTEEIPEVYQNLPGTLITENTTWSSDKTLAGPHYVMPGVTLTIEPGVTVSFKYHNGDPTEVGTIITLPSDTLNGNALPSGKLVAKGTASQPIVFTSARANPQVNDWGGIILAGRAPTNIPGGTGNVEGLPSEIVYGGSKPADDSGALSYVRIEFSGFSIAEGSELQGLSLYAVGSETEINHVNIYKGSDDGIEIFGGTVDLKYMVVYGVADDSYDFDQGWQGRGQFWLAVQAPGADNGLENDGCAAAIPCPQGTGPTNATIYNITLVGANESVEGNEGMELREGLTGSYNNIIITNFVGAPFELEGAPQTDDAADPTYENYGETLTLSGILIYNNGDFKKAPDEDPFNSLSDSRYAQSVAVSKPMFKNPQSYNFALQSSSPALETNVTPPINNFFTQVNYKGAFGTTDWTQEGTWVRWPN